jgi:hypothetical protein
MQRSPGLRSEAAEPKQGLPEVVEKMGSCFFAGGPFWGYNDSSIIQRSRRHVAPG